MESYPLSYLAQAANKNTSIIKKNQELFLLRNQNMFVDPVRICSLHVITRNHSNTFFD